jgi:hypothetical protein
MDDIIIDRSNFTNAKIFIKEQFEILLNNGYNLGLWFEEGNTEVRTLEDYLDSQNDSSKTKKVYAQMVTANWTENKKLSEFPHNLERKIEQLVKTIQSWNK